MTLRIAVDLDGVLADTMVAFCKILNNRHSTQFTVDSFGRWNAWEIAHITKDEFFRTFDEAWFDWKTIPTIEENIGERVRRIRKFGRVDVVTGRSEKTVQPAKAWLKQYQVPYDSFVRTNGTEAKAKRSYDVFIEDSPELMSLLASNLDRCGILYTQPWNKNAGTMKRVFRVNQWEQIPAVLEQVSTMKQ